MNTKEYNKTRIRKYSAIINMGLKMGSLGVSMRECVRIFSGRLPVNMTTDEIFLKLFLCTTQILSKGHFYPSITLFLFRIKTNYLISDSVLGVFFVRLYLACRYFY